MLGICTLGSKKNLEVNLIRSIPGRQSTIRGYIIIWFLKKEQDLPNSLISDTENFSLNSSLKSFIVVFWKVFLNYDYVSVLAKIKATTLNC